MKDNVRSFILNHWDNCVRYTPEDDGNLIGIPYPHTVPSEEKWNEIYYWDTYFTNVGLIESGRAELAKSNTDNILYLVNKFGFMPNGNRTFFLKQSQPPFLSLMVREIYDYYKDPVWLFSAYNVLKTEYDFWMKYRSFDNGLNHYDGGNTPAYPQFHPENSHWNVDEILQRRIKYVPEEADVKKARLCITFFESGWDCNPRWGFYPYEYAQVELNSLLYALEYNMSFFAGELGFDDESEIWLKRANDRKNLMNKYLLTKDGIYMDYNFEKNVHSTVFSVASVFPFFVGMADEKYMEVFINNFSRLETENGIVSCERKEHKGKYQWDYPNGWACLQMICWRAFERYGYNDAAKCIADKYIRTVESVFEMKGYLLEKYNMENPLLEPVNESGKQQVPSMLGWSAGTYMDALRINKKYV